MSNPERTALYRIYSTEDLLLYVGISKNFGIRWNQHAKKQPWWNEHRRMTVDWYDSRPEARTAETAAIQADGPKYNIAGRIRAKAAPRAVPRPPVWLPLYVTLKDAVLNGTYPPRTPLPSVRQIKAECELDKNTIAKAFDRLRDEGLIVQIPGRGAFVAPR